MEKLLSELPVLLLYVCAPSDCVSTLADWPVPCVATTMGIRVKVSPPALFHCRRALACSTSRWLLERVASDWLTSALVARFSLCVSLVWPLLRSLWATDTDTL